MSTYLLGIDIGTTGTKGILLHPQQGIVAEATEPTVLHAPHAGWAEEDPAEWWANVATVTQQCLTKAAVQASEVAGVGVSGMVPTLILLDKKGSVLRRSIQQNDARDVREIQWLQSQVNERAVLERTGSAITQQSIGPKVLWLRQHEADKLAATAHIMGSYDYIAYRLTGSFSCEQNWALESGLYDIHRQDWDDELLALAGIPREWLGAVNQPQAVVGAVTPKAAEHTGLAVGTPVVAGSADHVASAFSAGITSQGDMLVKLGGAGDILYCVDSIVVDPRLYLDYHVVPDRYLVNGCMASSGSILKWFRGNFAGGADYEQLDSEATAVAAGSEGLIVLPYFLGEKTPINDPVARGVFFGLTLGHSRGHAYRAILEGISMGFRHHLQVLAEQGLTATKARVTNGGARSALWKQVTADVMGIPLEQIAQHPGSSLGAAFIAGIGVGAFSQWHDIERFIQINAVIEPNPSAHLLYNTTYPVYRELYERNRTLFEQLS